MNDAATASLIGSRDLSELIGHIYDCALDPGGWEKVLRALADRLDSVGAILSVHDTQARRTLLGKSVGYSPEQLAGTVKYAADFQEMWLKAGVVDFVTWPLDEPITTRLFLPKETIEASQHYQKWAKPNGLEDSIGFLPMRQAGRLAEMGLGRHESRGYYTQADIDLFRLFTPHLRRAIVISDVLNMQTLARNSFESMLDRLNAGVFLVNGGGRILHANAAGAAMLATGDPVKSDRGILSAREPAAMAGLRSALNRAAGDESKLGASGLGIPARLNDGTASVLHVLPLHGGERSAITQPSAVAAVFVSAASTAPFLPLDALTALYDLTPAETRVLAALVSGKTKAEIAQQLGVSASTVNTHLLRLFAKTETSRQTELVQLVQSLGAPLVESGTAP